MLKKFMITASIIAMPAVVQAADMRMQTKAPAYAAASYNWSGFYAGVVGGGGLYQQSTPSYYIPDPQYNIGNQNDHGSGATFGGTLGFNVQSGNFVYGIEGDYSWSNLRISGHDTYPGLSYNGVKGGWDAFATLRGRAGLAVNNSTLAYVTGGLAFVNVNQAFCYYGIAECGRDAGNYDIINKTWVTGFAAGAGVEHAFTNQFRLKAEYLYVGLPSQSLRGPYSVENNYPGQRFSSSAHLLRLGLNMNF
jgi:outer membrane immunogenic protein